MKAQELAKKLHEAQISGKVVSYLQPKQCKAVVEFILKLLEEEKDIEKGEC